MSWAVDDYDELNIYISDGWREWYIPKFRIITEIDGDFVTIKWVRTEAGGDIYALTLDYHDVLFGYVAPSSAFELAAVIYDYIYSAFSGGAGGDVFGPGSSVDENVAVFDGTTGKLIKDGGMTIPEIIAAGSAGAPQGTVTSVALTVPSAFSIAGSPITSSGILAITGAGNANQYINGLGVLASYIKTLPPTFSMGFTNMVDATTHLFANHPNVSASSVAANVARITPGVNGTIKMAFFSWQATGAAGSNENVTVGITINDVTLVPVATVGNTAGLKYFANTGLNTAIISTDYLKGYAGPTTWATNPGGVMIDGWVVIEYTP